MYPQAEEHRARSKKEIQSDSLLLLLKTPQTMKEKLTQPSLITSSGACYPIVFLFLVKPFPFLP